MVYHEKYSFPNWPAKHTFPMDKFARLADFLTTSDLVDSPSNFFRPLDVRDVPLRWFAEPSGPIDPAFLEDFLGGNLTREAERRIGFREQTSRAELIERTVLEVAGTVLASQLALRHGIASNLAGGTHHASPAEGAGYTILNDLAVAAQFLRGRVERVLVVDCDVHQGDGTAKFGGLGGSLFTLSLHAKDNYPTPKATSDYDVPLRTGCGDQEYMQALELALTLALREVRPGFVLYDAGVDVYEKDVLGKLKISEEGIRKRDFYVLNTCVQKGIPVVAVIGGGYDKDVRALARRHAIVHQECARVWRMHKMWQTNTVLINN